MPLEIYSSATLAISLPVIFCEVYKHNEKFVYRESVAICIIIRRARQKQDVLLNM